jgi:hypothetical protein
MRIAGTGFVGALLCWAGLAFAAPGTEGSRPGGEAAARDHLSRHAEALGLTRAGVAPGAPSRIEHLGQTVWRFPLLVEGLPVFFRAAAVQTDAAGAVRRVACRAPEIPSAAPHPDPGGWIARDRARAAGLPVGAPEAGWLDLGPRLAPVVRAATAGPDPLMLYLAASSGLVLHAEPLLDHREPLALVFPENPVTTPSPALVRLPLLDPPGDVLYGDYARVERCLDLEECKESAPVAGPDPRGHFVYAPDLEPHTFDDAFAEGNAYFNITRISDWARRTFGWPGLFNGEEWIRVKVGRAFHNAAFYQGSAEAEPWIVFGQDTVDFAYDADVAFHEFGHAINRSTWSHPWYFKDAFGMNVSPFGIEEGLADIWAQTLSGDPVMNSYILASRSADNDLVCPDDLRGQGHMEARILSGMGWDTRRLIGAEPFEHAVYRTLALLVGEQTFDGFAEALATSLEDLAAEGVAGAKPWHATALRQRAEARGLYRPDCLERLVPLPEGKRRRVYGYGRERTSGRDHPLGLQWRLVAPEGAAAFRLFLDWRYPSDVEPGFRVLISRGDPVTVSWRDPDQHPPGTPIYYTDADLVLDGAPPFVDFPFRGLRSLEPGEEVYVLLAADTDVPLFVVDGSAWFVEHLGPAPEGFGGPGEDATSARAGCAAVPAQRSPGLLGLLATLRGA